MTQHTNRVSGSYRVYIMPTLAETAWARLGQQVLTKEIRKQFSVASRTGNDTLEDILAAWRNMRGLSFTLETTFSTAPEIRSYFLALPPTIMEEKKQPFLAMLKDIGLICAWDQTEQPSLAWFQNIPNEEYLKILGLQEATEIFIDCLNLMQSYGDNRWWLSPEAKVRAYFHSQALFQRHLILLPNNYLTDLEELLGTPITLESLRAAEVTYEEIAWCYEHQKSLADYIQHQFDQMEQRARETGTMLFIGDPTRISSINLPPKKHQKEQK